MKKFNFILSTCLIAAILCSSVSMQGMETNTHTSKKSLLLACFGICAAVQIIRSHSYYYGLACEKLLPIKKALTNYISNKNDNQEVQNQQLQKFLENNAKLRAMESAKQREQYNNNDCLLIKFIPTEPLLEIFSHCLVENEDQVTSLKDSIKTLMKLSCSCKKFNNLLTSEKIGYFCKGYAQEDKDKTIQELMNDIDNNTYFVMHLPMLILLHAGANPCHPKPLHQNWLLKKAIKNNDIQLVETLFKYKVNIEKDLYSIPILALAQTTEMAQLLINHKDNLCNQDSVYNNNILQHILGDEYSSDLIPFHIQHGADPLQETNGGFCLLHVLAESLSKIRDNDNFLKKAKILLNIMPYKINSLDVSFFYKMTPLDTVKCFSKDRYLDAQEYALTRNFIALLRKHGALTYNEIREKESGCTIF